MSGKRIFPRSNLFDGISSLTPDTIVFSDADGKIQSIGVGNGLSVTAGILNVSIPHTYDPSYGANIGTGTGIYDTKVGNTLQFKTLKGNSKIILTSDVDSVTINVVDVADLVHLHFIADVVGLQTALNGKEPIVISSDDSHWYRGDKTWQPITKNDISGLQNDLDAKENVIMPGTITQWYRGDKTWQPITKNDVGLNNVTNDLQLKADDLDTDPTLSANSDTKISSQKAVKQYVDLHDWDGGTF